MKKLLILTALMCLMGVSTSFSASFERIKGIGVDRQDMTAAQVEGRTQALKRASEFWLLRQPCTKEAPQRIFAFKDAIWNAAAENGIDPWLIASVIFVESCGRPDAKSPTGPTGIGQFTKASARDEGLKVKTTRQTRYVKEKVWTGRGKKRHQITRRRKIVETVTVIDERLDPLKSIGAMARRLKKRITWYGQADFAVADYHMGAGRLVKLLSVHAGRKLKLESARSYLLQRNLTYPDIFFRNSPYHNRQMFLVLQALREKVDFTTTYYFRVMEAYDLLNIYYQNPMEYRARWERHLNQFRGDKPTPNRMWTFYTPDQVQQMKFENLESLRNAMGTRLVELPQPWETFGYYVRLHGPSAIAEADPTNQRAYLAADPATIGCLIYVLNEVKLMRLRAKKKYYPYEVNSLVRTWLTQSGIGQTNSNAVTDLPTHTLGKAFDLPRKNMRDGMETDMVFILTDMENWGMLAMIYEGTQKTIHVVPHPEFEQFFTKVYRDAVSGVINNKRTEQY